MAINVGASPIDPDTLAGKVRVLVGDTDPTEIEGGEAGTAEYAWYSDEELEILGELFNSSPKRVAIWVLSQVALSEALMLRKWTSEDLQVDGPAIVRSMEATLKRLSAEVSRDEALTGDNEFFGIYGGTPTRRWPYPQGAPYQHYPYWR